MQEGFPLSKVLLNKSFKFADFDAVLFDFDGVIADSEPLHVSTKKATLDAFNIPYTDSQVASFQGSPETHFFDYFAKENNQDAKVLLDNKRHLFDQDINTIDAIKGSLDFIKKLNQYKPCYLVTSSIRKQMACFIGRNQLETSFKDFITCDDVNQHKPHPEPYLACIKRNNLVATRCLVIEDSPNGITSAKAAGCFAIGLMGEFSGQALLDKGADILVADYQELTRLLLA
jgi:HAD superfamily hydrolase (TIGR01509 family)